MSEKSEGRGSRCSILEICTFDASTTMAGSRQPRIPEQFLDIPSQRLYYLSLGLLCQVQYLFYIPRSSQTQFTRPGNQTIRFPRLPPLLPPFHILLRPQMASIRLHLLLRPLSTPYPTSELHESGRDTSDCIALVRGWVVVWGG